MAKKRAAYRGCSFVELPPGLRVAAAHAAIRVNPANAPPGVVPPQRLALLTSKYWGAGGVDLTVGFTEPISAELRDRILSHANAWGATANVRFSWSQTSPQVRVTRAGDGYWSYVGTDVLQIPAGEPTMCLEGFTMQTPEAEYLRVVRHEFGHTLGFPHEQQRAEILALLDRQKTIAYFRQHYGWSAAQTTQQVLTPLEERSIMGTPHADQSSIMCYDFPGECTKSGKPVPGGPDIDRIDAEFAAKVYPPVVAPPPPPPPQGKRTYSFTVDAATGAVSPVTVS